MEKVKVLYFKGCPNAEKVFRILRDENIPFEPVNQDSLPADDEWNNYSSPSIFVEGKLIYGEKALNRGCTFGMLEDEVIKRLKKLL